MVAIDTLFVLQAGAVVLLALASGLVLRLVTWADADEEKTRHGSQRRVPAPKAPDPLRRAA